MVRKIPVGAAALAVMLALAPQQSAADGPHLEMYIDNQTVDILYYQSEENVSEYPSTIPNGWTQMVRANLKKNNGQITYANNKDESQATCTMTLRFYWDTTASSWSGNCDKKTFTPTTTGSCTLEKVGTCYDNSCKCNFTLSSN